MPRQTTSDYDNQRANFEHCFRLEETPPQMKRLQARQESQRYQSQQQHQGRSQSQPRHCREKTPQKTTAEEAHRQQEREACHQSLHEDRIRQEKNYCYKPAKQNQQDQERNENETVKEGRLEECRTLLSKESHRIRESTATARGGDHTGCAQSSSQ